MLTLLKCGVLFTSPSTNASRRSLVKRLQRVAVRLDEGASSANMKAYSVDLREKIVAAVTGRGMSKAQAARTFGVGATSVKRYVKLQEEGKSLTPAKEHPVGKESKLDARAR